MAAELEKARQEINQTQAEVAKSDTKLEAMAAELAKAKEVTEQANVKATELEETAAGIVKDAEAERKKLQAALDQANAEIERLKSELEKQKSTPPEQGESVSPAPEERRL